MSWCGCDLDVAASASLGRDSKRMILSCTAGLCSCAPAEIPCFFFSCQNGASKDAANISICLKKEKSSKHIECAMLEAGCVVHVESFLFYAFKPGARNELELETS
jgi:hypothetical protein